MRQTRTTKRSEWFGVYSDLTGATRSVEYPDDLEERRQWMGVRWGEKYPFAYWGDCDAPAKCNNGDCPADRADEPGCDCDARFKWGYSGFYRTGNEVEHRVAGVSEYKAFIFEPGDGLIFVDGDDVRCPETEEVHPAFKGVMAQLGLTWCEVSKSGSGVHAVYTGELPENAKKQPVLDLDDEPWGSNSSIPQIEIYETKHVGVLTGEWFEGTPLSVNPVDVDVFSTIIEASGQTKNTRQDSDEIPDLDDIVNDNTDNTEPTVGVTDDVKDILDAIESLDAQKVAEKTICRQWLGTRSNGVKVMQPTWASRNYDGAAVTCGNGGFRDDGDVNARGGPVVMAAIDDGTLKPKNSQNGDVTGDDWWAAVDYLRDLGFNIPEYCSDGDSSELYIDEIAAYSGEGEKPFEDPDDCLIACLRAREAGAVPEDADPPRLALHAVINNWMAVDADSHAVTEDTFKAAEGIFNDVTVDMVSEFFGGGC